jgi:DNA ligase-1
MKPQISKLLWISFYVSKYLIQKAVSPDKVIRANRLSLREMENNFLAQPKHDGCCAVMVVGGEDSYCVSRTGEPVEALDTIREAVNEILGPFYPYALIGEAWNEYLPFNEISGEFRRHQRSSKLQFIVHDCIPFSNFISGECNVPYYDRFLKAYHIVRACNKSNPTLARWFSLVENFHAGVYKAEELLKRYTAIPGYDGIVLKDPLGEWKAGNGTTGEIIKIKNKLSYDLRVIGTVPGKGKHAAKIGSLVVDFNGSALGVGTGLTDKERELPEDYWIGKIIEVEAMTFSSEGLLREPRYKGIRYDKVEADTTC